MINRTVSYYNNADDSKSKIRYNLDYVLGMIKDNQELFQQTVRLRSMPTEKEYKQAKKLLPMIAPSGVFDYRNDDPENLRTRVRDKDCVKNRVKRAKIVRFTLC